MINNICKLCEFSQFKVLFDKDFKVLLCRNCGLVFLEHKGRDYKKYYSQNYNYGLIRPESAKEHTHTFYDNKRRNDNIVRWVLRNLPKGNDIKLLEIGCNAGFLLKRFMDYKISIFGIEPGEKAALFAKEVNKIKNIENCMFEDAKRADNSYDAVLLVQTFEHFVNPLQNLLKIRSVLKKDGILFIEVPNYYSPVGFYKFKYNGIYYPSPNHLFIYSRKTISGFLQKAGFKICDMHGFINIGIISKINENYIKKASIKFDNHYKVSIFFYLFCFINKLAIEVYNFFKRKE